MTKSKKRNTHSVFKRIPKIRDSEAIIELGRAHLLVALLAFALLLTMLMSLAPEYHPSHVLTGIAVILLLFVGVFSFAVSLRLYTIKRK